MARKDNPRNIADGRVLSYPMVPVLHGVALRQRRGTEAEYVDEAARRRLHQVLSWAPGDIVIHQYVQAGNWYIITAEVDAPPVGGVPIPRPRRRKRVKGERA